MATPFFGRNLNVFYDKKKLNHISRTKFMHIFLATGLSPAPLPGGEDDFISIQKIKADKSLKMVKNGGLIHAKSLIALFWLVHCFKKSGWDQQVEGF